jgi:hypothetical protein
MKKVLLAVMCAASPLLAQTDKGSLTGTVTDSSGGRIPSVDLAILSSATGIVQHVQTNGEGVFTVSSLTNGTYDVTFTAKGFETQEVKDLHLNVGQTYPLTVSLKAGSVSTEVQVTADAGLAEASAEIGGDVHGSQAQELPLNGRNYVSLVELVPGAIDSGTGTQDQVRFAGLSDEDNQWRLDGVDNSGINHQYEKVAIRLQPSTEAIAEFHASSVAYSADQGGSPGGQVELVSRSGTDKFHSSAWEFLRNNYFDATPPFTVGVIPRLHLNNFGANLGGPIIKQKLYFFANWESLRQVQTISLHGLVPSASLRAAVLAKSPALAPILNEYPTGTVATSNANVVNWYGSGPSTDREDSGLARVDYHVNDRLTAFLRYTTDHYAVETPGNLLGEGYTTLITPNIELGGTWTPNAHFSNTVRFGANRAAFTQGEYNTLPYSVVVSGVFTNQDDATGSVRYDNSFNTVDDATFVTGRNTIKFGGTVRRIQENKASPNIPDEIYTYASITNFQNNLMDSDSYNGAVPLTGQRMYEEFGYILDQYQFSPQLTINAGMRYEYFGVDHEVQGRGILVDPLNCPNVICPAGAQWYAPNLTDFSPRISVAYAPSSLHDKGVIRAGYGIYYGPGQFGGLGTPVGNITTKYTLTQQQAPGLSYPVTPYLGAASLSFSPSGSPINRKDTAVEEWTLSLQGQVAKQTIAQIAYFGDHASHTFSDYTLNGINPATGKRPYAGYSTIDYRGTFNDANTNALQASIHRDFSTGFLLSANYEYSHSLDNGGIGGGEADIPQDINCHLCEYASSDQDMRHYFAASSIYRLPVGRGQTFLGHDTAVEEFFLGGWQLSGIGTLRSGLPINITISRPTSALPDQLNKNQRPNLVPGVSIYAANKYPGHWFNPAAFAAPAAGVHGNAGRNIARGPMLGQMDTAVEKRFPVRERFGVSFRAEAFNVFNIAHYGTPASVFAGSNFGVITTPYSTSPVGTGTPRIFQFMLRTDF